MKENVGQVRENLPVLVSLNFILEGNEKVERPHVCSAPTENSELMQLP